MAEVEQKDTVVVGMAALVVTLLPFGLLNGQKVT